LEQGKDKKRRPKNSIALAPQEKTRNEECKRFF